MNPFLWMLILLLIIPEHITAGKGGRGSNWWGVLRITEPLNDIKERPKSNALKGNFELLPKGKQPLRKKQRKLAQSNPGSLEAVIRGLHIAVAECKFQFQNRRWNCPTTELIRGKALFGKIVQKGCRETAFIYAITSAGVTHSVARACSEGSVDTCTCDRNHHGSNGIDWEWGGCSDNTDFGYRFAKLFIDAADKGKDLRFITNLHNNEAGRLHVTTEMQKECKCHGLSGGCSLKTCWMRLPHFRDVGYQLKDRFDGASRVGSSNNINSVTRRKIQLKPDNPDHKIPSPKDLVYFENSPDFCSANPGLGLGFKGTQGRPCNASGLGLDGCDLMCCGRKYVPRQELVQERCNCTFHWCCQVHCQTCTVQRTIHTCL